MKKYNVGRDTKPKKILGRLAAPKSNIKLLILIDRFGFFRILGREAADVFVLDFFRIAGREAATFFFLRISQNL